MAVIILIAICTENYLKGLKYLEIVSQMFIEKTLQVYAKLPKVVGTAAGHFNDSHTFGVVLYFNLQKIHHHHDNPFSDWDVVYQCFTTIFCLLYQILALVINYWWHPFIMVDCSYTIIKIWILKHRLLVSIISYFQLKTTANEAMMMKKIKNQNWRRRISISVAQFFVYSWGTGYFAQQNVFGQNYGLFSQAF